MFGNSNTPGFSEPHLVYLPLLENFSYVLGGKSFQHGAFRIFIFIFHNSCAGLEKWTIPPNQEGNYGVENVGTREAT